ncbi:MAG: hypothetical protein M4579_004046 [Chaenotheca gracillima]|nr:MAG: hypothetical protein M4579_004046 [Chaenotheca gracillima]
MGTKLSPLARRSFFNAPTPHRSCQETCSSLQTCGQRPFSTASAYQQSLQVTRRKHKDPYALAQARQRKAANLSRQAILQRERAEMVGDPVRGNTTPFIASLRGAVPQELIPEKSAMSKSSTADSSRETPPGPEARDETHINHLLFESELRNTLETSHLLTQPVPNTDRSVADPAREEADDRAHHLQHLNAEAAMDRIFSLANAGSKDRTRANVYRCVQAFGRHETSKFLVPRPASNVPRDPSLPPPPEKTPRAGPDTGSSEVQIAILTTKIQTLADHMDGAGRKDKVNKRNLHLLVHRRQKLLKYLRRKERGGERWQYLTRTLGLTEASWKGEISLR